MSDYFEHLGRGQGFDGEARTRFGSTVRNAPFVASERAREPGGTVLIILCSRRFPSGSPCALQLSASYSTNHPLNMSDQDGTFFQPQKQSNFQHPRLAITSSPGVGHVPIGVSSQRPFRSRARSFTDDTITIQL